MQALPDDKELEEASEKARREIATFVTALRGPKSTYSYLGIKALFQENDVVEYVWLSDVSFDGTDFTGTVANNPQSLRNVKLMDRQRVSRQRVYDWMIVNNGKLVGGHTLRVLAKRMSPGERKQMEAHMGFNLD